jgi:hypothetical protein
MGGQVMGFRGGLAGGIEAKWGPRPVAGKNIGPLGAYRSRGKRAIGEQIDCRSLIRFSISPRAQYSSSYSVRASNFSEDKDVTTNRG